MCAYHDREWGVPDHEGRRLFEKLLLDGFQAGLSWRIILHRRDGLRAAFADFDPVRMAAFGAARLEALAADPRIIRNRLKIRAAVANARAYLAHAPTPAAFADFLWQFVGHRPVQHRRRPGAKAPTESAASRAMSVALRRRGFTFCGPTICYAFMQAVGMVNDHDRACFRHALLAREVPSGAGVKP